MLTAFLIRSKLKTLMKKLRLLTTNDSVKLLRMVFLFPYICTGYGGFDDYGGYNNYGYGNDGFDDRMRDGRGKLRKLSCCFLCKGPVVIRQL